MRRLLVLALLLTGCAAQNASTVPYHGIRLANADLAAALNKIEVAALQANQQGLLSTADTVTVSQIVLNATIASDSIETCIDKPPTTGTVSGCIQPFVTSIQTAMSLPGLGLKSTSAVGIFAVAITGAKATLTEIVNAEGGQ